MTSIHFISIVIARAREFGILSPTSPDGHRFWAEATTYKTHSQFMKHGILQWSLTTLFFVLCCCRVQAHVTNVVITRSIEINKYPKVVDNANAAFEQTLDETFYSSGSGLPFSQEYVSQTSRPFDGTHWKAEGQSQITLLPDGNPGAGAFSKCKLTIQFSLTETTRFDFSASVGGGHPNDNLSFHSTSRPLNFTHLSSSGQFSTSSVFPPADYIIDAECYAQDSSDSWHNGSFYFELVLHPENCIKKTSLAIPPNLQCDFFYPEQSIPSPQYANGWLEFRCASASTCGFNGRPFQLLWHDVNGTTYHIGMCRYRFGENGLDYSYDACANTVTEVRMSNAEGFMPWAPWRSWQGENDRYPDLYETDHYYFFPESKLLNFKKFTQHLNWHGSPQGEFEQRLNWDFQPAPTSFEGIYRLNYPSPCSSAPVYPDEALPRRALTDVFGTARAGHIYVGYRDLTVSLSLQGGESPAQVATDLGNLITSNTNFTSRGITAWAVAGPTQGSVLLLVQGAAEEDLWFSAAGQGAIGLQFIKAKDYPFLKMQASASNTILSWSTNAPGFVPETTTNCAIAASWTTVTNQPSLTNGVFRMTIPASSATRFFRLRHL